MTVLGIPTETVVEIIIGFAAYAVAVILEKKVDGDDHDA